VAGGVVRALGQVVGLVDADRALVDEIGPLALVDILGPVDRRAGVEVDASGERDRLGRILLGELDADSAGQIMQDLRVWSTSFCARAQRGASFSLRVCRKTVRSAS
jgi:hypothetical protein